MRVGAVARCGCALALMLAAASARAEREPAAQARARAKAVERQVLEELDQILLDAEREAEAGGDAVDGAGGTAVEQTAVPNSEAAAGAGAGTGSDSGSGSDSDSGSDSGSVSGSDSGSGSGPGTRLRRSARVRASKPGRLARLMPAPTRLPPPAPAPAPVPGDGQGFEHVVAEGETLGAIAAKYGTAMQVLLDQNPGLAADRIRAGQHILIDGERRLARVTVQPGDTLTAIARAQRVTVGELLRWNPELKPDRIRDGVSLRVFPRAPASPSASIGSPSAGRLLTGRRLAAGPGFAVRAPERAWGTDETVRELAGAFASLQRAFPRSPRIWVHDLSLRGGGPIDDHHSHQSGRDVDIAYAQRECEGTCGFRPLSTGELDARRTWALLRYWLERDALEAVFVDYRLQGPLYKAARASGASEEELMRWFQYPRGRGNPWGVIRHYPKHGDHMHVRFACHASDPACKTFRPLLLQTARR